MEFLIRNSIKETLTNLSFTSHDVTEYTHWIMLLLLVAISVLVGSVLNLIVRPSVRRLVRGSSTKVDDYLLNDRMLKSMCTLLPPLIFLLFFPNCFEEQEEMSSLFVWIGRFAQIWVAVNVARLVGVFLRNLAELSNNHDTLQNHYIAGLTQFGRIIVFFVTAIVVIAILIDKSPVNLMAGLGAAATVLMLVFKDSILGLVSGIQLSMNDMLKPGDWVTMESHNVDGVVETVSLTTVKVRNFDNTISTIPPYTLVSESFRNWKEIESRGRRVKRVLYIDVESIRFLTAEEIEKLSAENLISKEMTEIQIDKVVNLTLFRSYVKKILLSNPDVRTEDWVMLRQLEHTPNGLPVELYFYFVESEFVRYEDIAATCVENIIASLDLFGLRLFQSVSGNNLKKNC